MKKKYNFMFLDILNEAEGDEEETDSGDDDSSEESNEDTEEESPEEDEESEESEDNEEEPQDDSDDSEDEPEDDSEEEENDSGDEEDDSEGEDDEEPEEEPKDPSEVHVRRKYFDSFSSLQDTISKINEVANNISSYNDLSENDIRKIKDIKSSVHRIKQNINIIMISYINDLEIDKMKKIHKSLTDLLLKIIKDVVSMNNRLSKEENQE